jgi:hypothetical protein
MKTFKRSYPILVFVTLLALAVLIPLMSGSRADPPPKNKISFDRAKQIASQRNPGKLLSSGFENRGGIWIYSFDFRDSSGNTQRIFINALSGEPEKNLPSKK